MELGDAPRAATVTRNTGTFQGWIFCIGGKTHPGATRKEATLQRCCDNLAEDLCSPRELQQPYSGIKDKALQRSLGYLGFFGYSATYKIG